MRRDGACDGPSTRRNNKIVHSATTDSATSNKNQTPRIDVGSCIKLTKAISGRCIAYRVYERSPNHASHLLAVLFQEPSSSKTAAINRANSA